MRAGSSQKWRRRQKWKFGKMSDHSFPEGTATARTCRRRTGVPVYPRVASPPDPALVATDGSLQRACSLCLFPATSRLQSSRHTTGAVFRTLVVSTPQGEAFLTSTHIALHTWHTASLATCACASRSRSRCLWLSRPWRLFSLSAGDPSCSQERSLIGHAPQRLPV
jgi:hypothetical protein